MPGFFWGGVAEAAPVAHGSSQARGLGVKWELQMVAYTTASAIQDLSRVCDLHHSSQQHWILNPLMEARDQPLILMDNCWAHYH